MIELVIVIAIIGILSVGVASFLNDREKTQIYKAETCMNNINGDIKNFTNAALTSKMLSIGGNKIFPNYYIIEFISPAAPDAEHKILLKYEAESYSGIYKEISLSYCKEKDVSFRFGNVLSFSKLKMNKGFRQVDPSELFTFSLFPNVPPVFTGAVQFNLCLDTTCSREFARRIIDTRSQGIFPKKCLFYCENNRNKCRVREDHVWAEVTC